MSWACSNCSSPLDKNDIRCPNCFELEVRRLRAAISKYYDRSNEVSNPDSKTYRKPDTFRRKVESLFPRVEAVAANGKISKQSKIWGDGIDFWAMKHYLGAVSAIEYWDNRPLLTSVIINSKRGFPAEGYFVLVENLEGLPNDITTWSEDRKQEWWSDELSKVHNVWEPR